MKFAELQQADFGTAPLPEATADSVQKEGQEFPLVIATMPATDRQRAIAVGVVILLIIAAADCRARLPALTSDRRPPCRDVVALPCISRGPDPSGAAA